MVDRRTALSILGLAAAGSPAVAAESFLKRPKPLGPGQSLRVPWGGDISAERVARALRRLAESVASGEVLCTDLYVGTSVKPEDFVEQQVAISFVIPDRPA